MNGLPVCTDCGCTPAEFRARGLLGCPACYDNLRDVLDAELLQLHPLLYREPVAPPSGDTVSEAVPDVAALREQLGDALRDERYEEAARLRTVLDARGKATASAPRAGSGRTDATHPDDTPEPEVASPDAQTLATADVPWAAASHDDRILFARVLARRNFAGHPFWVSCRPPEAERIARRAVEHARTLGLTRHAALADFGATRIGMLRERMVLPGLPGTFPGRQGFKQLHWRDWKEAGGAFADHALSGEAEHWIRVRVVSGLDALDAGTEALLREDALAGADACSRSARHGLLTSDPAFVGNGLQYEAGLHLPALAAAGATHPVRQALVALGVVLTPLSLRDPDTAEAGFFRAATRGDTHRPWRDQLARFRELVAAVLEAESAADARRNARDPLRLHDRAHRALRVLQEARRMEHAELLRLVSAAREGVRAGLFPAALSAPLETLRVRGQPHHAQAAAIDGEDASAARARLSRSLVAGY